MKLINLKRNRNWILNLYFLPRIVRKYKAEKVQELKIHNKKFLNQVSELKIQHLKRHQGINMVKVIVKTKIKVIVSNLWIKNKNKIC